MPHRPRSLSSVPTILLVGAWLGVSEAAAGQASVLILLPGQPGQPAATAIAAGIRSILLTEWAFRVAIEMEHVDVARFASPEVEERRLRTVYSSKYGGQRFDIIVAALPEPFQFVLRARDELWPGTPVVVCGVDERSVGDLKPPPGFAVLTIRFDMEGTVAAARALVPDARHVALVGGASPPEQRYHDLVRHAVSATGTLDVIDLTKLPIADLLARLSSLPDHTVIMQSSYQVDGAGRRFYGIDLVPHISQAANRPVFTPLGLALGRGVVGGSIIDFEDIGRDAGMLAARLLRGEPVPPAPIPSRARAVPRFDGRQLARWRLDERRLPPNSEIVFRQPTLWQEYRWHVVGGIGLIGAQAVLIVALLLQRRERREAQTRLAERFRLEALVSEIGTALATVPAARLDEQMVDCLGRVGTFLVVDRGTVWQPASDGSFLATHSWRPEASAPAPPFHRREFAYLLEQVESVPGGLSFRHPDELPPAAGTDRAAFVARGIRSFAAIRLRAGDRMLGLLTFSTARAERAWPEDIVQQLQMVGEHFSSALIRAQSAAAVESSAAFTEAVLAALPGETAIIDATGVILQTNEAWARAAQGTSADAAAALSVGASYLEACRRGIGLAADVGPKVQGALEDILRGRCEEFALEYPSPRSGENRWLEVRARRLAHLEGGAAVTHFDVTARRQAEATAQRHLSQLAHLDRVAGMGQLAASIAHELNQPLTAILSNAQAAGRMLAAGSPDLAELRACLADIVSDDQRAAEVIRHMRRLLRKADFASLPLAVNDLVATTIGLVANDALLQAVTVDFVPAPALPVLHGDFVQIQQAILNLLANAITAAASGPSAERKVRVWTTVTTVPYVEIGVHDSGAGIVAGALDRVFEPFFTTRDEGLGMGLAISRSIVEAH